MMTALSASVADYVIFTMQDLRVEGSEKRINHAVYHRLLGIIWSNRGRRIRLA